jgi:hypothetical protein
MLATRMFLLTGLSVLAFQAGIEGTGAGQCSTACSAVETACKNNKLQVCGRCNYDYGSQQCTTPYCATKC